MKVAIHPAVLEWAIADAGLSRKTVAEEVGVPTATLVDWLGSSEQVELQLGQVRKLAATLKRSMSFFFLAAPPAPDMPKVAFRAASPEASSVPSPGTRTVLRETHGMQEFLAWLTRELHLSQAHLPEIGRQMQPHGAAELARQAVGVSVVAQKRWRDDVTALREWRSALETLGVSVFLTSLAGGPKGFSISSTWNPVIVVNTHQWNTGARIFTVAHELGHLLRGTDSSCMAIGTSTDSEERWCDRFAAAFLMPLDAVKEELVRIGWDRRSRIDDLGVVVKLARRFKVSLTAAVVRLISEDLAPGPLITKIPPASNKPPAGGSGDPEKARRPHRRLQQFGRRTINLLERAVAQEIVTKHEALSRLRCSYDEFDKIVAKAEAS